MSNSQNVIIPVIEPKNVILKGENKMDELKIDSNDILYISYEKNYINIFYYADSIIKEHLLRSTLSDIEKQLTSDTIVRCHRSYIVNTNQVEKIQGNARSYLLKIPKIDFLIPVSRTYPKELLFSLVKNPKLNA